MASTPPSRQEGEINFDSLDWEDFPPENRGESEADSLFVQIGRALSSWEVLESALAMVFARLCDGRSGESVPLASGRVYGYVNAGQMRMQMLLEVAELYSVFVNQDFDLKGLVNISKHYQRAARSRNNIAHGVVTHCQLEDGSDLGFFLGPSMYLSKGNIRVDKWPKLGESERGPVSPAWKYCYVAKDIAHFRVRYEVLTDQVHSVLDTLLKWQVDEHFRMADRRSTTVQLASSLHHSGSASVEASPAPPSEL